VSTAPICWKVAFASAPERVYAALSTDEGRRAFWAVDTLERDGQIRFRFSNGVSTTSRIMAAQAPHLFELDYFGMPTRFAIAPAGDGAIVTVTAADVPEHDWADVHAGWVSVLLLMKAYVDYGIDLRNGDPVRSWDAGFVDQ